MSAGAHNLWRLMFAASNGGVYVQLSEVAFLDANGNNLSAGGIASASSEYSVSYTASQAFDNSSSTDWCSRLGASFPMWLQYRCASAVRVASVRIVCSANTAWLPPSAEHIRLLAGDPQEDIYSLSVVSGGFGAGKTVVLAATRLLTAIAPAVPQGGYLQALCGTPYAGIALAPRAGALLQNYLRPQHPSDGVVSGMVSVVLAPGLPAQPFANGRIWLLRLADGYKAWEGLSDAAGWYRASGLEVGVEYIPVGIDPYRDHKAVAAGPVVAVKETP